MKKLALILLANASLWCTPVMAEEASTPNTVVATASNPAPAARTNQGGSSDEHGASLCSRDDPYIEFRDCVNASTRDSNAKVRMAQFGPVSHRT